MKFQTVATATPPRKATAEQVEYDLAIKAMRESGKPLAIDVEPEQDERSMRTKLSYAAKRAGVKVQSWYDAETARVMVRLKV